MLALLDADLAGPVIVLGAPQDEVEQDACELVRRHAIRAMAAWHLAVAALTVPPLLGPGEQRVRLTRRSTTRGRPTPRLRRDLNLCSMAALLCRQCLHYYDRRARGLALA